VELLIYVRMKKVIKKAVAKKPMMKRGGIKKPLPKHQSKGVVKNTPFQEYMKIPGTVASDTVMQTMYPNSGWDTPKSPLAKKPTNQKALEGAFEKTYGQDWKNESGQPARGETFEQYKRRMGPGKKKGGATKTTYKKGGTVKPKAKKMADGGPTGIQKVRRNILTNRIDNLNQKGNQNLNSGNKEKAFNQFDKADKLQQRRSDIRQKAGYKKGGLIKSKKK